MIPTADPIQTAKDAAAEWLAPLQLSRPEQISAAAIDVSALFGDVATPRIRDAYGVARGDHAYVDLQPGNGTAYRMHVTLLSEDAKRSLGYDLLVALPDFSAILTLDAHGFHVPWYIAEKAPGLNEHGQRIVAAWTSLLSAYLRHLRTF